MEKTKKNIGVLCGSLALIVLFTALAGRVGVIGSRGLRIAALVGLNLLNGLTALAAMKLTGMKIDLGPMSLRPLLLGGAVALGLSLVVGVIPALCGMSLVGPHTEFTWFGFLYELLFCLLVVGPVEEFVFRVYLQEALTGFFPRCPWVGVVLAAFGFGLWHLINGSLIQVLFTFGLGLVFGFAKHRIKACGYVGVAFAHGLYDFLNYLVRVLIV